MAQDVSGDVLDELQRTLREFSSDVADKVRRQTASS